MVWAVSLSTMKLSPHCLTALEHLHGIRSLVGVGNPVGPLVHPVLYLRQTHSNTLHLNAFRGEPAISAFDWHFTANHNSSEQSSTYTGSGLQSVLPPLHPGHG